jgi:hypothetical protein
MGKTKQRKKKEEIEEEIKNPFPQMPKGTYKPLPKFGSHCPTC